MTECYMDSMAARRQALRDALNAGTPDALQRLKAAYLRDPQWSQGSWPGCDPDWQTRVIPDADGEKS